MRIFANANYNFIKWRWPALIGSLVIIWVGVATIFVRGGLPLGIDFTGGTALTLEFAQPTAEDVVRSALGALSKDAVVQRFGDTTKNDVLVRLPLSSGAKQGASLEEEANRVEQTLRAANLGSFQIINKEVVGPVIGKDLQSKGVWATLTALGGILDLHRHPVPLHVRARRDHRHVPRHSDHAGVPDVVRVRPVAQRRRGHPHNRGLFSERHDRRLRPRA
jgi:preprotein translocase subunit SecF